MAIINSQLKLVSPQANGRAYVIEDHTDDTGKIHRVEYLANDGVNYQQTMEDRVPVLEAQITENQNKEQEALLAQSAQSKIEEYLNGIDLKKDAGLTDAELLQYEKGKG